uniref:Uncharacterized protein n=1 Tax=Pseudo-nitzschia australis TaxID=44445 RepID=A0A6U9ZHU8_9STRA
MGATESLFYDETPAETPSLPTRPSRATTTEPRPILSSNSINGEPRRLNNGKAAMRPQHPSRRRPPPQTKPIKRMEGLVLGCPKTGKRTLLSRLKGVDPFAISREMKSTNENGRNDTSERDNEACIPSITIPYKPPLECPTWDRIKLHVRYANSFDSDNEKRIVRNNDTTADAATVKANVDFVVVIINPKDSRETTQSYLEGVLKSYLDRSGHVEKESGSDNNNEGKKETFAGNAANTSDITEACCIAVLFNFRDLQKGQEKEEGEGVSTTDLELLVHKSLQSRNVPEGKRVVELFDTSLLNCYGLDGLHRFIYRAYLQRSQKDTERQLCVVRNQIQHTSTNNNEVKSKPMAYDEFLKEISPEKNYSSSQQQQQPTNNKPTNDQQQLQQHQEQPAIRSLNLPQSKQKQHSGQIPSSRIGEDALEAFLASSSDEEDEKKPIDRRRDGSPNNFGVVLSSDDDSDDDFFYDESGHRRSDHKDNDKQSAMVGRDGDRSRTGGRYHSTNDTSDSSDEDSDEEEGIQKVLSPSTTSSKVIALNITSKPKLAEGRRQVETNLSGDNGDAKFVIEEAAKKKSSVVVREVGENNPQTEETLDPILDAKIVVEEQVGKTLASQIRQQTSTKEEDTRNEQGTLQGEVEKTTEETTKQQNITSSRVKENLEMTKEEEDSTEVPKVVSEKENHNETLNTLENARQDESFEEQDRDDDGENIEVDTVDHTQPNDFVTEKDEADDVEVKVDDTIHDSNNADETTGANNSDMDDNNGKVRLVDSAVGVDATNRENRGDIAVGFASSPNHENNDDGGDIANTSVAGNITEDTGDDDDVLKISSPPAVKKVIDDEDDDDDDYMIDSAPTNEGGEKENRNDNVIGFAPVNEGEDDDDYVIDSAPVDEGGEKENEDTDYMVGSAPVNEGMDRGEENESDDDDYMISSAPLNEVKRDDDNDDDDDDDYMIDSAPVDEGGEQENDDDDDDDYMISCAPVNERKEDDDVDDDDYMIDSTPADEGGGEHSNNDDDDAYMISSTAKNERKEEDDDDDDDFIIESSPVSIEDSHADDNSLLVASTPATEDDEKDSASSPKTQLPDHDSIQKSSSDSTSDINVNKEGSPRNGGNPTLPKALPSSSPVAPAERGDQTPSLSPPPAKPAASRGISEAALAAIAAAQQEAEDMMLQRRQQQQQQQQQQQRHLLQRSHIFSSLSR